jgi:N-methylhydantoinase A/oxoprolinase/acetone carboxylase beta subunit
MIGTTHFTNAFVEARHRSRVGVLRLGAPATLAIRRIAT